jgi:hypothetical protein
MSPEIEKLLRHELYLAGCIDTDLVNARAFADIVREVGTEAQAKTAAAAMRRERPALFKERDYAKLDPAAQAETEKRLRKETPRPSRRIPKGLDWSLMSSEEFEACDRYISGKTDDNSTLRRVAAKQGLS